MTDAARTVAMLVALAAPLRAQTLATRLDQRLDAPGLDHLFWGMAVTDTAGHLLYGRNADRLFIPASNTKLVVSITANALLGPSFTVMTSVYATGPVQAGVLQGDLVLYGRGDPTFSNHCYATDTTRAGACGHDPFARLRELAQQLRARGVRSIAGDLIGDGSYFESTLVHPSWENFDLAWWYAAPVSGLGFNDNALDVHEAPADSVGRAPLVTLAPDLGAFALDNHAETGARGSRRTFDLVRTPDLLGYIAIGSFPAGAPARSESAAVGDPNRFAAIAFRRELLNVGITVRGATRSTVDSFTYRSARSTAAMAEVRSRPLRDWIYPILSASQNWFAEMLIKQLGRQRGTGGSWEAGREVERRFLIDSIHVDSAEFSLQDGSGLAADNYLSPRAFTQLLRFARNHADFDAIHAALPMSGHAGSLRDRFVGTPAAAAVHAKTGSISGVNTLSGYVERADGTTLIFSLLANHHTLPSNRILAALDSVVAELARP